MRKSFIKARGCLCGPFSFEKPSGILPTAEGKMTNKNINIRSYGSGDP